MDALNDALAELCKGEPEQLSRAGEIADFYRSGADLRTLIPLLTHSNSQVASCGAWIVSEVVNQGRGREILRELSRLLYHSDPYVRFHALSSVAILVDPNDQEIVKQLIVMVVDENAGVRRQALRYLCFVASDIVEAMRNTDAWQSVRLMSRNVSRDDIVSAIKSDTLFEQRMAILGAIRNFGNDVNFINEILPYLDEEVATCLPDLPRISGKILDTHHRT